MSFSSLNAYKNLSNLTLNNSVLKPSYNSSTELLTLNCQGLSFGVFIYDYLSTETVNIDNIQVVNMPEYSQFQLFLLGNGTGIGSPTTLTVSNPVPYNVYYNNGDFIGNSSTIDGIRGFYLNKSNGKILISDAGTYVNSN
jgi:hypothetical protein